VKKQTNGPVIRWTPESGWVAIVAAVTPKEHILAAMKIALPVYQQRLRGVPLGERRDKMLAALHQFTGYLACNDAISQIVHAPNNKEVSLFKGDLGYKPKTLISIG
jgi:mannitol/fructose-specific phosphotransferase system IIA component (Ntr-type)